ncbi:serine hydrolase domain-containing protein [Leptospira sp. GIMC2001]|uniref:serine hydrolase domain-containing protein n=1 Tax=Leptospira sp. GIMC2001 TaxID=1513297 RepID=UPI0004A5C6D4|nr:serine hydrolase domain-containing protein [Leptospira sp. GIMC2001]AID56163.1 beta-lactamase [Leptospira sp. GIMC2001]WCL49971.1 serine hydrolase [Leptospira sp. GIMC2001]
MLFRITIILSIIFTIQCSEDKNSYSQAFQKKVNKVLADEGLDGGYVVVKNGNEVISNNRLRSKRFHAGNLNHYLLSISILRLYEKQGKVFDKPVRDSVRNFPNKNLTPIQLMNHTSGLGTNLEPGGYWIRSKENVFWLIKWLESESKMSVGKFFKSEFFEPLSMNNSEINANGDFVTTLEDLMIWDKAWDEGEILSKSLKSRLIEVTELKDSYATNRFGYGFGVYTDGMNFWQYGTNDNYSVVYYKIPDQAITIIILARGRKERGDLLSWKTIITESMYNTKRITFMEKFNQEKYINIEQALVDKKVPAVGIALVRDFKVVWSHNYGHLEAGTDKTVNAQTLFRAGSLTKPIAAITYLLYAKEQEISLQENLNSLAKESKVDLSQWKKGEILTADSILSHSSGITERENWNTPANQKVFRLKDLNGGRGGGLRTYYTPGKKSRYSGGGYALLQENLRRKSKKSFDRIAQEYIFDPLGMRFSTFLQDENRLTKNKVSGHSENSQVLPMISYSPTELSAGGLWTTPTDLAKFFIEILLSIQANPEAKFPIDVVESMTQPVIPAANLSIHSWIGRGFFLNKTGRDWYIYHGGHSLGHKSFALFHKHKGYGVVIMTNSENGSPLIWSILRTLSLSQSWDKFIN